MNAENIISGLFLLFCWGMVKMKYFYFYGTIILAFIILTFFKARKVRRLNKQIESIKNEIVLAELRRK
jgi:hypothetical protein